MSMVGGSGTSLCRAAVEFRPGRPLARSSLLACLAASTMIVGIGFGVAVNRNKHGQTMPSRQKWDSVEGLPTMHSNTIQRKANTPRQLIESETTHGC